MQFPKLLVEIYCYQDKTYDTNTYEDVHVLPTEFVSDIVVAYPGCKYEHEIREEVDHEEIEPFLLVEVPISHWVIHIVKLHLNDRPEEERVDTRKDVVIKQACHDGKRESGCAEKWDPKEDGLGVVVQVSEQWSVQDMILLQCQLVPMTMNLDMSKDRHENKHNHLSNLRECLEWLSIILAEVLEDGYSRQEIELYLTPQYR